MIEVDNIRKSLADQEVLRGASFRVKKGEFTALIGSSGGGKSVMLKHIAGLMQPDSGQIRINGEDLSTLPKRKLRQLRRHLGFLFQSGALFDSLTVFDNVAFPMRERNRLSESEIRQRVMDELEMVGLTAAAAKLPGQLSGGMVKRAALARALVMDPEVILVDEPVSGLDPIIGNSILALIRDCQKRLNFTGVIVTHELKDVFKIVHTVAMLHEGRIHFTGTPAEVQQSDDPVVSDFITGNIRGLPIHNGAET